LAIYPSFKDATVYVTGGASGISAEIVRAFADQRSRVGFLDVDVVRGDAFAAELREQGADVHFEPCDLCDIDALRQAFVSLEATLGSVTTGKTSPPSTTTNASLPTSATSSSPSRPLPRYGHCRQRLHH
jgi:NAD(P)-dependent dehydrogenase (short-subunit alcohol dehydrogenase family)